MSAIAKLNVLSVLALTVSAILVIDVARNGELSRALATLLTGAT